MSAPKPNKLNLLMSISLVMGNMIGAGIFLLPAALAPYGGISIGGWLISAFGAFILALLFSKLNQRIPGVIGGPYAYSRIGLGDFPGFMVAWGYWNSIWVANAAIAIAFVGALSIFFPLLETEILPAVLVGLAAIWVLTWVNARGIRASGQMQVVTTFLKIIPLLVVTLGGIFYFDPEHLTPLNPGGGSVLTALAVTATLTLYAFLGIESATIPADQVADSKKTVSRATLLGTLFTTLLYILSTIVVMGMVPLSELADSPAPYADAMNTIASDWGRYFVAAGVALAAFGGLNGWILVQGQVGKATARDGLFPSFFKRENSKGVPTAGLVFGSMLTSLLMVMNYSESLVDQFRFMILLTTICTLVPYFFSALAYIVLAGRDSKRTLGIWFLGGIALLYSVWAIYGAGSQAILWGTLLLLTGIPIYFLMRRSKR